MSLFTSIVNRYEEELFKILALQIRSAYDYDFWLRPLPRAGKRKLVEQVEFKQAMFGCAIAAREHSISPFSCWIYRSRYSRRAVVEAFSLSRFSPFSLSFVPCHVTPVLIISVCMGFVSCEEWGTSSPSLGSLGTRSRANMSESVGLPQQRASLFFFFPCLLWHAGWLLVMAPPTARRIYWKLEGPFFLAPL